MQAGKDEVRVDVSSADYSRCLLRKQNGYWSALFLWHLRQTLSCPDAEKNYAINTWVVSYLMCGREGIEFSQSAAVASLNS